MYLIIAGIFETTWAVGLKYTEGFTRLWPTVGTVGAMLASVYFLEEAVKTLPIGTAYTVWTGIGAVGAVVFGIILFGESKELPRLGCVFLIIAGIIGLKIFSPE